MTVREPTAELQFGPAMRACRLTLVFALALAPFIVVCGQARAGGNPSFDSNTDSRGLYNPNTDASLHLTGPLPTSENASPVTVTVEVLQPVGPFYNWIDRVRFYAQAQFDAAPTLIQTAAITDMTDPTQLNFQWKLPADGVYTISAEADLTGDPNGGGLGVGVFHVPHVSLSFIHVDSHGPTVNVQEPTAGATLSGLTRLSVKTYDESSGTKLVRFLDET